MRSHRGQPSPEGALLPKGDLDICGRGDAFTLAPSAAPAALPADGKVIVVDKGDTLAQASLGAHPYIKAAHR